MKINISNTCQENWSKMNPISGKGFCQSCQKSVTDFTQKSDKEIIDFIALNSGKICGRLTTNQLKRELVYSYTFAFKFSRPLASVFAALSFVGIAKSQNTSTNKDNSGTTSLPLKNVKTASDTSAKIQFFGKVVDKNNGEAIPFASVSLSDSIAPVYTDFEGNYLITCNKLKLPDSFRLKIHSIGYSNYEIVFKKSDIENKNSIMYDVKLVEMEMVLMGDFTIIEPPKKNIIKRIFSKKRKNEE